MELVIIGKKINKNNAKIAYGQWESVLNAMDLDIKKEKFANANIIKYIDFIPIVIFANI